MPAVADGGRAALLRLLGANADGRAVTLAIGYHGNGRTPDTTRQTGTAPRVRWGQIGQANAWHPFAAARGRLTDGYFRVTSGDNELETTVSIAQRPHESLDFPLIGQVLNGIPACRTRIDTGEALEPGQYDGGTVSVAQDGMPTTHCWLYVVLVGRSTTPAPTSNRAGPARSAR